MLDKIVKKPAQSQLIEKKSRFICRLEAVSSEEEALDFVKLVKKECYDARHNCYAYIIGSDKHAFHSSDDGEPSGTAGRPILETLEGAGLYNVVAVVTRYFGGVLLGTGGLVRAYQGATKLAIEEAEIASVFAASQFQGEFDYTSWGKVEFALKDLGVIVQDVDYSESVSVKGVVKEGMEKDLENKIVDITSGKTIIQWGQRLMVEV